MAARTTTRLLAATSALGVLVAGCGDSGEPGGTVTASPTPTSQSPTSDPTPTESTSAPTVAPATGKAIRLKSLTGSFPAGWRVVDRTKGSHSAGDTDPLTGGFIYASDVKNLGSEDFDDMVANVLVRYENEKNKPVRTENRVVDGIEGWVLESATKGEVIYEFGTVVNGQNIRFTITYFDAPPDAMAVIDSVFASIRWR